VFSNGPEVPQGLDYLWKKRFLEKRVVIDRAVSLENQSPEVESSGRKREGKSGFEKTIGGGSGKTCELKNDEKSTVPKKGGGG